MRRRWGSALTAVLLLSGCLFELAELVPPGGAGGNGGSGLGGNLVIGGGGNGGGNPPGGAGNGNDPCPANQKFCNGECQPPAASNGCGSDSCEPCAAPPNSFAGCDLDTQQCRVEGCQPGYGDCNGDALGSIGVLAGDGCEYSFGAVGDGSAPLTIPFRSIQVDDNERNDWEGLPVYEVKQTCVDCSDDVLPLVVAQNEAPPATDLAAYFRVAWDQNSFYVLVEGFDNHIFKQGAGLADGRCNFNQGEPGPGCEDAFALFFDGRDNRGEFREEDRWIFIGSSGQFYAPAQGQPPPSTVALRVLPQVGEYCYRMEAQFDWNYIVNTQSPIPGKFPPLAGQTYGFDVAVADWDPSISDESVMERQSQLFWNPKPSGLNYRLKTDGLGSIQLAGGPHGADAGTGAQ